MGFEPTVSSMPLRRFTTKLPALTKRETLRNAVLRETSAFGIAESIAFTINVSKQFDNEKRSKTSWSYSFLRNRYESGKIWL